MLASRFPELVKKQKGRGRLLCITHDPISQRYLFRDTLSSHLPTEKKGKVGRGPEARESKAHGNSRSAPILRQSYYAPDSSNDFVGTR
jgi:hypothetical protein